VSLSFNYEINLEIMSQKKVTLPRGETGKATSHIILSSSTSKSRLTAGRKTQLPKVVMQEDGGFLLSVKAEKDLLTKVMSQS
jgi:hypothetical protein